ncbi:MAG: GGDEF domain-containing protein [Rubrivivax sp.]|nr:GGDEF domain-containing protein [Rubrivivax sp.]
MNPHPPTALQLLRVLSLEQSPAGPGLAGCDGVSLTQGTLDEADAHQVVLLQAADGAALRALPELPGLARWAHDRAVVVVVSGAEDEDAEAELLRLGVEAIVPATLAAAELVRALRHAHQRKLVERGTRTAYATDLTTGLPHQAQLLEHMTQLIALRERESAPLVLIALRVEGVAQATAHLGDEAANVLRRKVAVRLRGGLRASDVVASLGPDLFAVMLGRVDMVTDGEGVAAKLLRAVEQPFLMTGRNVRLGAAVGIANYPAHGKDAGALLKRATAQAAMVATVDEQGVAVVQSGFGVLGGGAANDPE